MLSAADLAQMRAAQAAALPDTATIKSAEAGRSDTGGITKDWSGTTTVACRLSSRGVPQEYLALGATRGVQYWMVTLPHGAAVTADNRLVIGARTLEIVGFASGGEWETALRAVCKEAVD
jgi:head-tail adaptor